MGTIARPVYIEAHLLGARSKEVLWDSTVFSGSMKPIKEEIDVNSSNFDCISIASELSMDSDTISATSDIPRPNRKRRLEHLSVEEKIKRKKLKNRVAAQTSRDRKKARMDELEAQIRLLQENNKKLTKANTSLIVEKEKLATENLELRQKISDHKSIDAARQSPGVDCSPLIEGPAVPDVDPLPQGSGLQLAPGLEERRKIAMWTILTFYTLCQISSPTLKKTSRFANLKNLQQVYFEKLLKLNHSNSQQNMQRAQGENAPISLKWWGPRQNSWNPVED